MQKFMILRYRRKIRPRHILPIINKLHGGVRLSGPLCGCSSVLHMSNNTTTSFKEFDLADSRLDEPDICKNCLHVRKKLLRKEGKHAKIYAN